MYSLLIADSSKKICAEISESCAHYPNLQVIASVYNGKDALDCIQTQHVNILLLDIMLPVLDGLSVIAKIQDMEEDKRPSVFVHTAFLDDRLLQELQHMKVVYCFVKPTISDHIIPRILQLMRGSEESFVNNVDNTVLEQMINDERNLEITRQIRMVGIPAHLRGYHYLRTAIFLSVEAEDPSMIAITKDIYPYIAEKYHTRATLVERSIRNAIEVAWNRGNPKILHQYFGYTIDDFKGKPTNAEFIAMIADRVRMINRPKINT